MRLSKILDSAILTMTILIGLAAFFYPFFIPVKRGSFLSGQEHAGDAPLFFFVLMFLVLAIILAELTTKKTNSKVLAVLSVTVGVGALIRFIPLPLGASGIFFLIITAGYVFGANFGFLTGSLIILVSSFFSGGFGPWVPFQMFACGLVGATSAFFGQQERLANLPKLKLVILALFGGLWGYLFGGLMNIWFWPYLAAGGGSFFSPGMPLTAILKRYFTFYLATSFFWDTARAVGNFVLILFLGAPLIKTFKRFKNRFQVQLD